MHKQKGFSLVEVTLVLAIAGVIFAMVFAVLPGLWASERDSERRDDLLTFIDTLKSFQANNNRGALPTLTESQLLTLKDGRSFTIDGESITPSNKIEGNSWADFYANYFSDAFADPDGYRYNWVITYCSINHRQNLDTDCSTNLFVNNNPFDRTFSENDYNMYIVIAGKCYGEGARLSANSNKIAVLYKLEAGGLYCAET